VVAFATSLNNHGYILLEEGDWRQAEPLLKQNLDINLARLGPNNPRLASAMNNWARVLQAKGDYAQALEYYERSLSVLTKANAAQTWPAAQIRANVGMLYFDRAEFGEAERNARDAMELRRSLGGDGTPAFADSLIQVAEDRAFQGDPQGAEPLLRSALDIRRRKLWSGHPAIMNAEVRLGETLMAEGKASEAEPLLRQAVDAAAHEPFPLLPWQIAEVKNAYGECLKMIGRPREAAPLLRESRAALASDPRPPFRTGPTARLLAIARLPQP
jgi:tetratricopeptide (TPR) repeat protein